MSDKKANSDSNSNFNSNTHPHAELAYLEVYLPDGQTKRFELFDYRMVVGRTPEADLQIDDPQISRRHAKIKKISKGRWLVRDLGSRNKTLFNHRPITSHVLNNGDEFYFGDIKVVFHDPTGHSDHPMDHTVYQDGEEAMNRTYAGLAVEFGPEPVPAQRSGLMVRERPQSIVYNPMNSSGAMDPTQYGDDQMDPGGESGGTPINMALVKRVFHYKWTIGITFVFVSILGVALVWTLIPPKFTAEAKIQVRPIIPRLVFSTEDNGIIPLYDSYKNTQASIILSPKVLQRALDQADVKKTSWFQADNSALPIERLQKDMEVKPEKGTEIISVTMDYRNPNDAAVILNMVLNEYIKFTHENTSQTSDFVYGKLSEEIEQKVKEIETQEKITARLRKELGTGMPDELITQKRARLEDSQAKLEAIDQEIEVAEAQQKKLEAMIKQTTTRPANTTDPGSAKYAYDPEWRRLNEELTKVKNQIEVDRQQIGESHPRMQELQKRVRLNEDNLKTREGQLDKQVRVQPERKITYSRDAAKEDSEVTDVPMDLEALKYQIQLLKLRKNVLAKNIQKQKDEFNQTFGSAQLLVKESENLAHQREIYNKVRTRLDEKEMEGKVPGSIDIIAPAIVPTAPEKDKRKPLTAAAIFGALAAGIGLAYMRVRINPTIAGTDELSGELRMPFLGEIPLFADPAAVTQDYLNQNESVRMVRTCLLHRIDNRQGNAIVVTSADTGAGKTTLSVILARSLAQAGKKVLLVDGDIHHPNVAPRLGIKQGPGLLAVLKGEAIDAEAIFDTQTPGLSVLPTGISQNGTRELLANGAFTACLNRWRQIYDVVLLDSSPVLPVADARILSRQADGTILVVREKHCQRENVVKTLASLSAAGGKLLGIVYIGSSHHTPYGSYPYNYGNKYPASDETEVKDN